MRIPINSTENFWGIKKRKLNIHHKYSHIIIFKLLFSSCYPQITYSHVIYSQITCSQDVIRRLLLSNFHSQTTILSLLFFNYYSMITISQVIILTVRRFLFSIYYFQINILRLLFFGYNPQISYSRVIFSQITCSHDVILSFLFPNWYPQTACNWCQSHWK